MEIEETKAGPIEESSSESNYTSKQTMKDEYDGDEAETYAQEVPELHIFSHKGDCSGRGEACTQSIPLIHTFTMHSLPDDEDRSMSEKPCERQRLASLDVFRGLTIAVMILVDDAGGLWPSINHSPWHGVTLADFVMPFFLFIVGISIVLSFKKTRNKMDAFQRVAMRGLKLFILGVFLQGGYFGDGSHFGVDMKHIRIMGILQRISIAYTLVAFCEIFTTKVYISRQSFKTDVAELLTMYPWHWAVVLVLSSIYVGVVYGLTVPDWHFNADVSTPSMETTVMRVDCDVRGDLGPACNGVGYLDRTIMGINHLYQNPMYRRTKECSINSPDYGPPPVNAPSWCFAPFDPEGLLSSLMAAASCFIGAHYGHALVHFKNHRRRLYQWIASGMILTMLGFVVYWLGMPLNKPLYTISYVCVTGGAAGLLFSVTYVLVDVWNYRKPFLLLEWMGMNALLIFVLAAEEVFSIFIQGFYWGSPQHNLVSFVEVGVFQRIICSRKWSKMAYVLFEILFWCLLAGLLKKRGIFWKF